MAQYAALDVSQETTAICLVDESGKVRRQAKVATCPETISRWFAENATGLVRIGMETGPLAVWLWNELDAKGLPVVCMDARHANAALKMRPNKTDRNDAAALAQIVRTGWFKHVRIKSRISYEIRSLLAAREVLVRVGSSSRMRSEDCFAPSGFCLARQPAGSPGVPTRSWPVSLMPRHQCASLWRTSCRLD
jgi:transposase